MIDKESNGMLNLVTLTITDQEVNKEYKQHRVELYYMCAEIAFFGTLAIMCLHALNYWVFKKINIPQLSIAGGFNLLLAGWYLFTKKCRKFYTPVVLPLFYMVL